MSAKNFGNQQFYFLAIPKEWEDGKCTPRRYPAFLTFEDLHRKAVTSKKDHVNSNCWQKYWETHC